MKPHWPEHAPGQGLGPLPLQGLPCEWLGTLTSGSSQAAQQCETSANVCPCHCLTPSSSCSSHAGVRSALGLSAVEGFSVGRPVDMQCAIQRPGTGRLLITGEQ